MINVVVGAFFGALGFFALGFSLAVAGDRNAQALGYFIAAIGLILASALIADANMAMPVPR